MKNHAPQGFDYPQEQSEAKWLIAALSQSYVGWNFIACVNAKQISEVSKSEIRFHNFLRPISEDCENQMNQFM